MTRTRHSDIEFYKRNNGLSEHGNHAKPMYINYKTFYNSLNNFSLPSSIKISENDRNDRFMKNHQRNMKNIQDSFFRVYSELSRRSANL